MAYYDNVNTTILDLVDSNAKRICEFGCGAGALARAIREKIPHVHYIGIELAKEQLDQAMSHMNEGLPRNLDLITQWSEDRELDSLIPINSLDHIIFGDVLEHLYDPQRALTQAASRLLPGGSALICIPNVQHWSVFVHLVSGSWPQEDAGLFDRTHIRWFTLNDMIRLVENSGLLVEHVEARVFSPEQGLPFLEDLEALAHTVGVDPNLLIQRGQALQYVLVGRKSHSIFHDTF